MIPKYLVIRTSVFSDISVLGIRNIHVEGYYETESQALDAAKMCAEQVSSENTFYVIEHRYSYHAKFKLEVERDYYLPDVPSEGAIPE